MTMEITSKIWTKDKQLKGLDKELTKLQEEIKQ